MHLRVSTLCWKAWPSMRLSTRSRCRRGMFVASSRRTVRRSSPVSCAAFLFPMLRASKRACPGTWSLKGYGPKS